MLPAKDRLRSAEDVLMTANKIAQDCHVASAKHAWIHMAKYGVVVAPHPSNHKKTGAFELLWTLNENETMLPNPPLLILPIAKEDADLGAPY